MATQTANHDEHVLRRFFDSLYELTPENARRAYKKVPKRIRRMAFNTLLAILASLVMMQLAQMLVAKVEEASRPSITDRLIAPYDLEMRPLPLVETEGLLSYPIPSLDAEQVEAAREEAIARIMPPPVEEEIVPETVEEAPIEAVAAVESENAAAVEGEVVAEGEAPTEGEVAVDGAVVEGEAPAEGEAAVDGAVVEGEAPAEGEAVEGAAIAEEPPALEAAATEVVEAEPEPEELTGLDKVYQAAIWTSILPEIDQTYFMIHPQYEGYIRTYVYDNLVTHPTVACLVPMDLDDLNPCDFTNEPVFVEAGDFTNIGGDVVRIVAAQYADEEEALDAIGELHRYSRRQGSVGNYAVTDIRPVAYFFAYAEDWHLFTWRHGEWVFSVTTEARSRLADFIETYPY